MDTSIAGVRNPCQAIMGHGADMARRPPYLIEFMGFAVTCRTARAAVDLVLAIAAERESATGH
jgi:hypothetical protein